MKFNEISHRVNEWLSGGGPLSDIVISSRIRLARNLAGYKFLSRCGEEDKKKILNNLRDILLSLEKVGELWYVDIDKADALERHLMVERHLISSHLAFGKGPRGAVIGENECFTAMINEEDHLRMQVLMSGLRLSDCFDKINRLDDQVEENLNYAFHSRFGYLTACPTNVGTGIRVSVMLHLPALKMTEQIKKFFNAAKTMNLAVRGLFGEGSKASGDLYQLSNQVTLGVSEKEIVDQFEKIIIPEIAVYEKKARVKLMEKEPERLDDKIARAMALLKNAHLISSQEAMLLLSHLRLGINMYEQLGLKTPAIEELCKGGDGCGVSISTINELFMLTLPAHLQINSGKTLDSNKRDVLRAKIIREALVR